MVLPTFLILMLSHIYILVAFPQKKRSMRNWVKVYLLPETKLESSFQASK